MAAAATTPPREVFPAIEVPAHLVFDEKQIRAQLQTIFSAASASGSLTAAPYPEDYYRRERLPPSEGGNEMSTTTTSGGGGGTNWLGIIGAVVLILFLYWLLFLPHAPILNFNGIGGSSATWQGGTAGRSVVGVPTTVACPAGYTPKGNRCVLLYDEPRNFVSAPCSPGDTREVPVPGRPGYATMQTCGYAPR